MKKVLKSVIILTSLIVSLNCFSNNHNPLNKKVPTKISNKEKLDFFLKTIDTIRQNLNVPGVGISIIKDNEILYSGGLGYSNKKNKTIVDENTVFAIGSCTKSFTGVLTSKLVEKGLLDWDKPLKEYIPNLRLKEKYIEDNLTLLDALSHSTGLKNNTLAWKYKDYSKDKLLDLLEQQNFSTKFRASYNYNNMMFALGGLATEKVTGNSWESLIKSEIFAPLNMKNSFSHFEEFIVSKDRAIGYQKDGISEMQPVNTTVIAPSGSIFSTPYDMSKWLYMFVNNGTYKNTTLLKPESYNFIAKPHKNVSIRNGNEVWYYYAGIGGYSKNGKRSIGHNGSIDGYNSRMVMKPEEGFAIMIMTNQISEYKELIVEYAEEWFLKGSLTRQYDRELGLESIMHSYALEHMVDEGKNIEASNYMNNLDANRLGLVLELNINALSNYYLQNGYTDKAIQVLNLNTLKFPKSSNAFNNLGEALYKNKQYDKAIKAFKKALELDPNNKKSKDFISKIKN